MDGIMQEGVFLLQNDLLIGYNRFQKTGEASGIRRDFGIIGREVSQIKESLEEALEFFSEESHTQTLRTT